MGLNVLDKLMVAQGSQEMLRPLESRNFITVKSV